MNYSTEST